MNKKKRRNHDPVDYWDSLADVMVALFLCILLIVLLFILYFVQLGPSGKSEDEAVGNNVAVYIDNGEGEEEEDSSAEHDEEHDFTEDEQHDNDNENNGAAGAAGGPGRREEEERTYSEPVPRIREMEEEGEKSAVLVKVVDGETMLPLAREGISFELYDDKVRLLMLNDYYPNRVEHTSFETTNQGQFYLPEKIKYGGYILRPLGSVEGYEVAQDTPFEVDKYYDWEEPLEVLVRMLPLRSAIHVQLVDKDSGEGVAGGSFQVVAAENIVTLDGSVRYRAGETVDTIELDGTGNGESAELYYGKYRLRQELVPDYYGIVREEVEVELKEKSVISRTLEAEKTSMVVTLRDALYDDVMIPGAQFSLSGGTMDTREGLVTDAQGQLILTNLRKNTTYILRQTSATDEYRLDETEHSFTVDGSGLIQDKIHEELDIENRMTRLSFRVSGTLLGNQVSDVRMGLTDMKGNAIQQWTTSGQDNLITGLEPGSYKLYIGNDLENAVEIYVSDEASVQEFHFTRWTLIDTTIVLILIAVAVGAVVFGVVLFRRRKQSKGGAEKS